MHFNKSTISCEGAPSVRIPHTMRSLCSFSMLCSVTFQHSSFTLNVTSYLIPVIHLFLILFFLFSYLL